MYQCPYNQYGPNSEPLFDVKQAQDHFDDFYQDLFLELCHHGEIEEIFVCKNLGDHLVGNVYAKFYEEESAQKALDGVRGRYYAGRPLVSELSPVTDFREARCRQFDVGECNRGGYCNFMHLANPSREVFRELDDYQRKLWRKKRRDMRKVKRKRESEGDRDVHSRRERDREPRTESREHGTRERERDRDRGARERDLKSEPRERERDIKTEEEGEGRDVKLESRERERDLNDALDGVFSEDQKEFHFVDVKMESPTDVQIEDAPDNL